MASYDVEEILERRKKGNKVEYLVRWAPSWELEKNLNCAKLLKEFKAKKAEENGDQNDAEDDEEEEDQQTDEEEANTSRRTPRKAATAANKKRKASQKATPGKRGRKRRR